MSHEIGELKELVFNRDHWTCQYCGKPLRSGVPQLAHLIPQRKGNLKKYGKAIIHHPLNFLSACSLDCNNRMQVNNVIKQERIVEIIKYELAKEE